jgi:DsbC/DsbD-like thiol-disulfide interchange protein
LKRTLSNNPACRIGALVAAAFVTAVVGVAGQNVAQKPDGPIVWSIQGDTAAAVQKPGGEFNALVTAKIDEGWHLYSTDEAAGGPRPTVITMPKDQPFEIAGDIDSPLAKTALDENFGVRTDYYEGSATFTVPVRVAAQAVAGRQKLLVEVRYQSCSKELCLPPKTAKLELAVDVQSAQ